MRPTINVHSTDYQQLLQKRKLHNQYQSLTPYMQWALEVLDRLEKKQSPEEFSEQDHLHLAQAKAIINFALEEKTTRTEDNEDDKPEPTHYIWRTQGDGNVRPEHAANDGKIFAWNDAPPTGHPGEDYGCRCWAEDIEPEEEEEEEENERVDKLQEYRHHSLGITSINAPIPWTRKEFFGHYKNGKGRTVTLREIGHLKNILDCAEKHPQTGGGSIFERVSWDISRKARQNKGGNFLYSFRTWYEFEPYVFEIGGATVGANADVHVTPQGKHLIISADIHYNFFDLFNNPYDYFDIFPIAYDPEDSDPFLIVDYWKANFKAAIKRDSTESKYPDDEFNDTH